MKHAILTALLTLTLAGSAPADATKYNVDTAHSTVGFSITHLQLSEVEGRFNDFEGTFMWDDKDPSNSSLEFTAKATSVDTGNAKRDDHLRGNDFFNVAKYPTLSFKSTKIEKAGGTKYRVVGDLTMHGTTKTVTVPATVKGPIDAFNDGSLSIGFNSRFKIDRIDYGVGAGWKGGSDKIVGHDVFVTIKGEAHQPE